MNGTIVGLKIDLRECRRSDEVLVPHLDEHGRKHFLTAHQVDLDPVAPVVDRWQRRRRGRRSRVGGRRKEPQEVSRCRARLPLFRGQGAGRSVHEQAVVTGDGVPTAVDGRIEIPDGRLDVVDLFVAPVHLNHGISMHVIAESGRLDHRERLDREPARLQQRLAERRRACEVRECLVTASRRHRGRGFTGSVSTSAQTGIAA